MSEFYSNLRRRWAQVMPLRLQFNLLGYDLLTCIWLTVLWNFGSNALAEGSTVDASIFLGTFALVLIHLVVKSGHMRVSEFSDFRNGVTHGAELIRNVLTSRGFPQSASVTPDSVAIFLDRTQQCKDDYHSMDELYANRHILFVNVMVANAKHAWVAAKHSDGSSFPGFCLCGVLGIEGSGIGQITYHLPLEYMELLKKVLPASAFHDISPVPYDGHTNQMVMDRLFLLAVHHSSVGTYNK